MQGIDISNYQTGMNLSAVPHDFALVLATYGTSFVDHSCNGFVSTLKAENKPWGVYHYCTGAEGEADYFINNIRGYVHEGILALDWESGGNKQWGNTDYLASLIRRVKSLSGVNPVVYTPASAYNTVAPVARELNCGMWVADYASMNPTGYQANPWHENEYGMILFQYSSNGRLSGYARALDLDKAYIDAQQWKEYAMVTETPAAPAPSVNRQQLVDECWGTLPEGYYIINNIASQEYVITDDSAALSDMESRDGALNQAWYLQHNDWNHTYSFQNLATGNWLTIDTTAQGSRVSVKPGDGSTSQDWIVQGTGEGSYRLRSFVNPVLVLDLPGDVDGQDKLLQVWPVLGNNNQKWYFTQTVSAGDWKQSLNLSRNVLTNGQHVRLTCPNGLGLTTDGDMVVCGDEPMEWTAYVKEDGSWAFQNTDMLWLTMGGSQPNYYSPVTVGVGTGSLAQQWVLSRASNNRVALRSRLNPWFTLCVEGGIPANSSKLIGWDQTGENSWFIVDTVDPTPKPEPDSKPADTDTMPSEPKKAGTDRVASQTGVDTKPNPKTTPETAQEASQTHESKEDKQVTENDIEKAADTLKKEQPVIDQTIIKAATGIKSRVNKTFLNIVYWVGIGVFIAAAILVGLASAKLIPAAWTVIATIVSGAYGLFSHTLGVSYTQLTE